MGRLKPLPYSDVTRRLERAGFVATTQKGSHVKFVRTLEDGSIDTVIVPKKTEVVVGTLRSILLQAHIEPADWENLA